MLRKVIVVCALVLGAVGAGGTAKAEPIPPPSDGLQVFTTDTLKTGTENGNCRIHTAPEVRWYKHPPKIRWTRTVGHYAKIKVEIMTRAGFGGTLWKSVAKRTWKSGTVYFGQKTFPYRWSFPLAYTVAYGTADYRSKTTVTIKRNQVGAVDTAAWRDVYWGNLAYADPTGAICPGIVGG